MAQSGSGFFDIAANLRELSYKQRLKEVSASAIQLPRAVPTSARVLDAAVASSVILGESTDVVWLIRTSTSQGLKAILQVDNKFQLTADDVRSKAFEVEFPRDGAGRALPAVLGLSLDSPGFSLRTRKRKFLFDPIRTRT